MKIIDTKSKPSGASTPTAKQPPALNKQTTNKNINQYLVECSAKLESKVCPTPLEKAKLINKFIGVLNVSTTEGLQTGELLPLTR